jgi:hypothetical protein
MANLAEILRRSCEQCYFFWRNFASFRQRNWENCEFSFCSVNSTNFANFYFAKCHQNFNNEK